MYSRAKLVPSAFLSITNTKQLAHLVPPQRETSDWLTIWGTARPLLSWTTVPTFNVKTLKPENKAFNLPTQLIKHFKIVKHKCTIQQQSHSFIWVMSIQNNRITGGMTLANCFLRSAAKVTFWNQKRSEDNTNESQYTISTCWENARGRSILKTFRITRIQFF